MNNTILYSLFFLQGFCIGNIMQIFINQAEAKKNKKIKTFEELISEIKQIIKDLKK